MNNSSKSKRIINFIVDFGIVAIVYLIVNQFTSTFIHHQLLLWILFLLYYLLSEIFTGQTLGKRITKTKVVNYSGSKPSVGWIVIRTLLRFNPFDLFSFLFGNGYGAHDLFSKTKVVEE